MKRTNEEFSDFQVLLIEDYYPIALGIQLALYKLKCVVDIAQNGVQALEKASTNTYDLILMDIGLPDMEGTEIARQIRAFTDTDKSQVPIVVSTANYDRKDYQLKCLNVDIQTILPKPICYAILERIISDIISKKKDKLNN